MAGTSIKSTAFSPSHNLGLKAVFLRRDNAGRGKLGYIRKLSGRAPTQNQVWAVTQPSSLYHSTLYPNPILLQPLETLLFFVSSWSCPTQTHSWNNTKPDSDFSATSLSSYTVIFLEIDEWIFKNLITYNNMLKTSLLIAFWGWSWYINMLPNQLSKLALTEFNILKA